MKLLTENTKTKKGTGEYEVRILQMLPATLAGELTSKEYPTMCPMAESNGCYKNKEGKVTCIVHSGRGKMGNVEGARLKRTVLYHEERELFFALLRAEIIQFVIACKGKGKKPAVRLNGFSDVDFTSVVESFPGVQFYDYTKRPKALDHDLPNYHLTFSFGKYEKSLETATKYLKNGGNVAVVFDKDIPSTWWGFPVLNGDEDDLRFLDPAGYVVGLTKKGGKALESEFLTAFEEGASCTR